MSTEISMNPYIDSCKALDEVWDKMYPNVSSKERYSIDKYLEHNNWVSNQVRETKIAVSKEDIMKQFFPGDQAQPLEQQEQEVQVVQLEELEQEQEEQEVQLDQQEEQGQLEEEQVRYIEMAVCKC
jgi:hypothetical protein